MRPGSHIAPRPLHISRTNRKQSHTTPSVTELQTANPEAAARQAGWTGGGRLTGHDLEAVEPLLSEARDNLVRVALLVGVPVLDAVEDIDGASPGRERRGVGRLPAEHLAVHGLEVDDGYRQGAVHVEDHPAQRPPPRPRGGCGRGRGGGGSEGGGGHDPAAADGAAAREGRGARGEGPAEEHAWRDLGR